MDGYEKAHLSPGVLVVSEAGHCRSHPTGLRTQIRRRRKQSLRRSGDAFVAAVLTAPPYGPGKQASNWGVCRRFVVAVALPKNAREPIASYRLSPCIPFDRRFELPTTGSSSVSSMMVSIRSRNSLGTWISIPSSVCVTVAFPPLRTLLAAILWVRGGRRRS